MLLVGNSFDHNLKGTFTGDSFAIPSKPQAIETWLNEGGRSLQGISQGAE